MYELLLLLLLLILLLLLLLFNPVTYSLYFQTVSMYFSPLLQLPLTFYYVLYLFLYFYNINLMVNFLSLLLQTCICVSSF
jgi:predicted transposase YdaD